MKDNKYKSKWILLVIIWSFAIGVFVFNLIRINHYIKKRKELSSKEIISRFLKQNSDALKKILRERERLYDHVVNQKIASLKVQELLNKLAKENRISIEKIEQEQGENNLKLAVRFNGALKNFLDMLSSLTLNQPYIEVNEFRLWFAKDKSILELKIKYNFILDSR